MAGPPTYQGGIAGAALHLAVRRQRRFAGPYQRGPSSPARADFGWILESH